MRITVSNNQTIPIVPFNEATYTNSTSGSIRYGLNLYSNKLTGPYSTNQIITHVICGKRYVQMERGFAQIIGKNNASFTDWGTSGTGSTTADTYTSPNGVVTSAAKVNDTDASNPYYRTETNASVTANKYYSMQGFFYYDGSARYATLVRENDGSDIAYLKCDLLDGTISDSSGYNGRIISVGGNWYYVTISSNGDVIDFIFKTTPCYNAGSDTGYCGIWLPTVYQNCYPISPILNTTGSLITKQKDVLYFSSALASRFNQPIKFNIMFNAMDSNATAAKTYGNLDHYTLIEQKVGADVKFAIRWYPDDDLGSLRIYLDNALLSNIEGVFFLPNTIASIYIIPPPPYSEEQIKIKLENFDTGDGTYELGYYPSGNLFSTSTNIYYGCDSDGDNQIDGWIGEPEPTSYI
jgi:hypothetical protein